MRIGTKSRKEKGGGTGLRFAIYDFDSTHVLSSFFSYTTSQMSTMNAPMPLTMIPGYNTPSSTTTRTRFTLFHEAHASP